jgi:hypothetical protein
VIKSLAASAIIIEGGSTRGVVRIGTARCSPLGEAGPTVKMATLMVPPLQS